MKKNIFSDIHTHILPEIDDGAESIEVMQDMLKIAYDDGTRVIVATPHCHPGRDYVYSPPAIYKAFKMLCHEAAKYKDLKVYLNIEFYYTQDIEKAIDERKLLMMMGNHIMIEFSPEQDFFSMKQGIQNLLNSGYKIILVHSERYKCLADNINNIELLHSMGVKIQINARSITDGRVTTKRFIHKLLRNDWVYCFASDAHDTKRRAPKMRRAAEIVEKKYGYKKMRELFYENGKRIITGRGENV